MFSDIKSRLNTPKQREPMPVILFSEILFADDSLIFGEHTASLNKLLKEIELESAYYNMNLKKTRRFFQPRRFKFKNKNGELISEKDFAETAAEYFAEAQWPLSSDNNVDHDKEQSPLS